MGDELAALVKKRGTTKRKLTNFIKFVEPLSNEFNTNSAIDEDQLFDLKLRVDRMSLILDEFEGIQCEIEQLCDENSVDVQYAENDDFINRYNKYLAIAQKILTKMNDDKKSINSNASLVNPTGNAIIHDAGVSTNVKLPVIQLPKFRGSYDDFLYFKDTFESLIHRNQSINLVQKFHYLKAALEGPPAQIIRSLEFSENNYAVAWELICDRYHNPRILIHNHIKALFNLPLVSNENSVSLRNLLDTVSKHLRALDSLGQPTQHWDSLITFLISTKLDRNTASDWEKCKSKLEGLPSLDDCKQFLKAQADLVETLELNAKLAKSNIKDNSQKSYFVKDNANVNRIACNYCKKPNHKIYKCIEFAKLSLAQRLTKVAEFKLCTNCLCAGHDSSECKTSHCSLCKELHNRLLHPQKENNQGEVALTSLSNSYVLLSTVKVIVLDIHGNEYTCNAILDSASQSNFISKKLIKLLRLPQIPFKMAITGINDISSSISVKCNLTIKSLYDDYSSNLSCLILNKITNMLPNVQIDISTWNIPSNVKLADDEFHVPKEIDLLIGASHFWSIIKPGRMILGKNLPQLQNTVFGYTMAGQIQQFNVNTNCFFVTEENLLLNNSVKQFWSVEECPDLILITKDDQICEDLFMKTFSKDCTGRFIVKIPLKDDITKLGDSESLANKRFLQLENRLEKNPSLKQDYNNFMYEYLRLGHMELIEPGTDLSLSYFLPHHAVIREDSLTSKIRVVFNGSAQSTSGYSINDLQYTGPAIQSDLFQILINLRKFSVVVTADIEKMYRQILIHPDDRKLQRIVYRFDSTEELKSYNLKTVTYGTASAPYLAIRCLKQLAIENHEKYPDASFIINNCFYVDDLIVGFDNEYDATRICSEVSDILMLGKFSLRKWRSNNAEVLATLQNSADPSSVLQFGDKSVKTLGIHWDSNTDQLSFSILNYSNIEKYTKRHLLSEISQIFDPLGLIGPCVIVAKMLIQKLWLLKISWDDEIPEDLKTKWIQFRTELTILNQLSIPRHAVLSSVVIIELHGFCDSSTTAYGACIYLRSVNSSNTQISLLCSKTKVAPLKPTTMPRLELIAALMLSKLYKSVMDVLNDQISSFLWSDSTVALHWIHTEPYKLQQFVANRVHIIQELTAKVKWNYVQTKENPADMCSRGLLPKELIESSLWWHGPSWLYSFNSHTYDYKFCPCPEDIPELKKEKNISVFHTQCEPDLKIFNRFSNFQTLLHVVAYCLRFANNCTNSNSVKITGPLSVEELEKALLCLTKLCQIESFSHEFKYIESGNLKKLSSRLRHVTPFIDEDGVIRIRGRLKYSNLTFEAKHPILLDASHQFSYLLFTHEHYKLLHVGPQQLLNTIRQKYWPIKGMYLAKKIFRTCLTCFKFKPKQGNNFMGDLPTKRVTSLPPFSITGVDYAGPFAIKDRKGRGYKITKGYICLFICFSVKAVHIELSSDLTTENFIACLRRFSARRGYPIELWSDNGLNFVGASNMLNELHSFLSKNELNLVNHCAKHNMTWKFNPPNSPHFGGIWESNIKNLKTHLTKVISGSVLAYEEFSTVLVQIESILNSRPLHPMSSDPADLTPLTPSHFLIGRPLVMPPDPNVLDLKMNMLSRYQLLQQLFQSFWKRWSRDYLSSLQHRYKWNKTENVYSVGEMVLLKNDNLPPSKWLLGRIVSVHPGSDGVVRVVTIQTARGVLKRAITKVCVLPVP